MALFLEYSFYIIVCNYSIFTDDRKTIGLVGNKMKQNKQKMKSNNNF